MWVTLKGWQALHQHGEQKRLWGRLWLCTNCGATWIARKGEEGTAHPPAGLVEVPV